MSRRRRAAPIVVLVALLLTAIAQDARADDPPAGVSADPVPVREVDALFAE